MRTLPSQSLNKIYSIITCIIFFCLILFIGPTLAQKSKNPKVIKNETHWYALIISGKKSGYMKQERFELENSIKYRTTLYMEINRSGTIISSTQIDETHETKDGKPLSFSKSEKSMGISQSTEGIVLPDGTVKLKIITGKKTIEKRIKWPEGALLNEGIRLESLKHGLKEGTKFTILEFSLNSLTTTRDSITIGKIKTIKMIKGQEQLIEIKHRVTIGTSKMELTAYVDKSYLLKRMDFDLVGSKMIFQKCSKEYALSPNEKNDIMASMNIPSPFKLKKTDFEKKIQYKLKINSNFQLNKIQGSAEQKILKINQKDKSITLSVKNSKAIPGGSCTYNGNDKNITIALNPSNYVQSNDERIIKLAKKIVRQCTDPYLAAKKIEAFVRTYINKKNLNVGYASAIEVLENREGDCSEHAVLTTALCRALGIPAKVATGFVYVRNNKGSKNIFIPHAWTLVYIKNQWISIDAAIGKFGSGHILIESGNGDPFEFAHLVNILGNIEIIEMDIKEN